MAGVFSTAVFSSELATQKINDAFDSFKQALVSSVFYDGVKKVGITLHEWGTIVVGAKDDFKNWLHRYLGADGLKSGIAQLLEKLYDWALIVYGWFKDKFIEFIKNIPDMVKHWDRLRLSLFKWGTFLGGGGGSALWAMFGSGANWDKLGELMAREDFGEIAENLGKLMENNSESFEKMETEEIQEILEKFLYETDDAKAATEELLKQQEEKKKEAAEEAKKPEEEQDEKKKSETLSEEEIKEAFAPPSGGSPKSMAQAFGNMVALGLNNLVNLRKSFFADENPKAAARKGMEKYLELLQNDAEKEKQKNKKDTIRQQFLDTIKDNKKELIDALADAAEKAYKKKLDSTPLDLDSLIGEFLSSFENKFTEEVTNGQEGDYNLERGVFKLPNPKKKR